MANCWLYCVICLCFSLSCQAENISNIFDESNKVTNDSENIRPLVLRPTFDYDGDCDCGYGSYGCSRNAARKICFCKEGFAQNKNKCEECYCGYNSRGCIFVDGERICKCRNGYSNNEGTCQSCDCGDTEIGCTFEKGAKSCHCYRGTAQKGGRCEVCTCGRNTETCYFESDKKVCSCFDNYKQNYQGECEECDCGYNSKNCVFQGFLKQCTCEDDYIYVLSSGKCEKCYCGPMATSCELTFDKYTRCKCHSGYVAERNKWAMNEECKLSAPSGWRIGTYIESVLFGTIILICTALICCKRSISGEL